jgi:hypothetical protein
MSAGGLACLPPELELGFARATPRVPASDQSGQCTAAQGEKDEDKCRHLGTEYRDHPISNHQQRCPALLWFATVAGGTNTGT